MYIYICICICIRIYICIYSYIYIYITLCILGMIISMNRESQPASISGKIPFHGVARDGMDSIETLPSGKLWWFNGI